MRFADPGYLWLLLLLPVFWGLEWFWLSRRAGQADLYASGALGRGLVPALSAWTPGLRLALWSLGVAALIVGLARPQTASKPGREARAPQSNLMLAVDCSLSMLARDSAPDRISVAKQQMRRLIAGRPRDRIGLIAFAGEARAMCPATVDHDALLLALSRVQVRSLRPGSDPAAAVDLACRKLEALGNSGGAVVLATDGEDTRGGDLAAAAQAARALGIRLFTLGVGTPAGATIPIGKDLWGREQIRIRRGQAVVTRLVSLPLRKAAQFGGGSYRALDRSDAAQALAAELDRLPPVFSGRARTGAFRDRCAWLIGLALLLLAGELLLPWRRKEPR